MHTDLRGVPLQQNLQLMFTIVMRNKRNKEGQVLIRGRSFPQKITLVFGPSLQCLPFILFYIYW